MRNQSRSSSSSNKTKDSLLVVVEEQLLSRRAMSSWRNLVILRHRCISMPSAAARCESTLHHLLLLLRSALTRTPSPMSARQTASARQHYGHVKRAPRRTRGRVAQVGTTPSTKLSATCVTSVLLAKKAEQRVAERFVSALTRPVADARFNSVLVVGSVH